jgi:hypothetical protein
VNFNVAIRKNHKKERTEIIEDQDLLIIEAKTTYLANGKSNRIELQACNL